MTATDRALRTAVFLASAAISISLLAGVAWVASKAVGM